MSARDPAEDLRRIAFCLERALEPSYRVKAFRTAAGVVDRTPADELAARAGAGTLTELSGIGKVTALVVTESLRGEEPVYLRRVETLGDVPVPAGAADALAAVAWDPATVLLDVIYAPWPTAPAAAAAAAGCRVAGGLEVLLHQAVGQVELMTGRPGPTEAMAAALMAAAGERRA